MLLVSTLDELIVLKAIEGCLCYLHSANTMFSKQIHTKLGVFVRGPSLAHNGLSICSGSVVLLDYPAYKEVLVMVRYVLLRLRFGVSLVDDAESMNSALCC